MGNYRKTFELAILYRYINNRKQQENGNIRRSTNKSLNRLNARLTIFVFHCNHNYFLKRLFLMFY